MNRDAIHPTTPQLTGPKRQHFLPKFYLEGFAKDGLIALFDRELNETRVQPPVNTCVVGHFYTLEDSEGRKRFELEQLLSEYESKASHTIRKLSASEAINTDERTDMAIFVAFAAVRTPDIIDSLKLFNANLIKSICKRTFSDIDQVKEQIRGKPHAPSTEEELEADARHLIEFAQSGQYEVKTDHRWAVGMAMKMAFGIAPILAGRNWLIIHCENVTKSFVTTDAPALLTTMAPREESFWGIGFGNADSLVLFPLTQSCLLAVYGNDGALKHCAAGAEQVQNINLKVANHCQRFLIGRDEALVRSLSDRLNLAQRQWQPKMQCR